MSSYDKIKPGLGLGPNGHTRAPQTEGTKQIKCDCHITMGQPADIGKSAFESARKVAPPSRIYDRDYSKVGREKDETDYVTEALGNPLRW